jgi:pimeloyl-ACP methyl ester carboxylesterase
MLIHRHRGTPGRLGAFVAAQGDGRWVGVTVQDEGVGAMPVTTDGIGPSGMAVPTRLTSATSGFGSVRTFDGARLSVWAEGDPLAPVTVVLVHGWTLTAQGWSPHLARLTTRRQDRPTPRVISFDLRAHGSSERGTAPITVGTLAADLSDVLAAYTPTGPVVLVGHSLGGMAVLALAESWPELFGEGGPIAGTVLVSTSARGASVATSVVQRAAFEGLIARPRVAELVRRLVTGPCAHPRTLPVWQLLLGPGPDAELARRSAEDFRDVPLRDIVEFYRAQERHDSRGRLQALSGLPTSVLVGANDKFMTPAMARELSAEISGSALRVLRGYGHDLPYDRPDVIVDAVEEVISQVLAAGPAQQPA